MRKEKIGVIVIGLLVAAALAAGFALIGSPVAQSSVRYDEIRYSDFQQIKGLIEGYYQTNARLPQTLDELPTNAAPLNDPLTRRRYDYFIVSDTAYQLCAEFATNADEFAAASGRYYDMKIQHKQGYSCIDFKLPAYILITPKP